MDLIQLNMDWTRIDSVEKGWIDMSMGRIQQTSDQIKLNMDWLKTNIGWVHLNEDLIQFNRAGFSRVKLNKAWIQLYRGRIRL